MPYRTYVTEGPILYHNYQFGYCQWMECGSEDSPGMAYSKGFLPYSAEPADMSHRFYMARSIRVRLTAFQLDKNRRYDHRAWQAFPLQRVAQKKELFLEEQGDSVFELAEIWMKNRFGKSYLSSERLKYIFGKPFLTDVLKWELEGSLVAFALIPKGDWGAHYWYVFYKNDATRTLPPGHGYLVDFLEWCRLEESPYAYLGTGYGLKSRYKSRGIGGVEFWDGQQWNPDKKELAQRQAGDDSPEST